MKRREFIKRSASLSAGMTLSGLASTLINGCNNQMPFKISLAEWSLHRTLNNKEIANLDHAAIAENNFGIKAIEYVNSFFFNHANDKTYLTEMKNRADDHGVKSLLIMCDNEGNLGDPDDTKRTESIENHYKWAEAAKFLDCHSIRVNARSFGSYDEQIRLAADGLQRLVEFGDNIGINIIVENHGGLSSNGEWLSSVMKKVNHPRMGTLPDFGNFLIENDDRYDRYKGMKELMPFAKAVSAKSHEFDEDGDETGSDYYRIMNIVLENGYNGYVGIEYEVNKHIEMEGIRLTNNLLK